MAQELPYLFPDLSMQDFAVYQKGYIQTQKILNFLKKRNKNSLSEDAGEFLINTIFFRICEQN